MAGSSSRSLRETNLRAGSGPWVLTAGVEVSREQSGEGSLGWAHIQRTDAALGVVHLQELLQESARGDPGFGGERRG